MNTQEIKRGEYNAYYPISELKMAIENNGVLTSINEFKPTMELYLKLTPKYK